MATGFSPGAGRSPALGQPGPQKIGGLDVLVGTGGQPRDCLYGGWVDQVLGSRLVE